jgi:hypothetical protein
MISRPNKSFSFNEGVILLPHPRLFSLIFAHTSSASKIHSEETTDRSDVGWYQIRNALKARNVSGDTAPVSWPRRFREGCAAFLLPIWHLRLAISRPRLEK